MTTRSREVYIRLSLTLSLAALLAGCAPAGFSTAVGPTRAGVLRAPQNSVIAGIRVIDLDISAIAAAKAAAESTDFIDAFGDAPPAGTSIGIGDALDVTIWEAPPATLFGASMPEARSGGSSLATSRGSSFPAFWVGREGTIKIPFAGEIPVVGRTLPEIEHEITRRLVGKANQPQVLVRYAANTTAGATLIGELGASIRMPLSPKGERLLDGISMAGGTRQPASKISIQITRRGQVASMPLERIIRDPRNNITLQPDDIVAAIYKPYSFTALGAVEKNSEVEFEATGINLAQALGRIGGLQDTRGDPRGMFLFRWENPALVGGARDGISARADGKIPVIFRVNLSDPSAYFLMQEFAVRNGDVIYTANSPVAEFQRFVNIISSTITPALLISSALP